MSLDDVIIIGAGHNGLLAAALLARAGIGVRVLERNTWPGGATGSRADVFPGCIVDQGATVLSMLRLNPAFENLDLERYGLRWSTQDLWGWQVAQNEAPPLCFWRDIDQTCTALEAENPAWGRAWHALIRDYDRLLEPLFRFMGRAPTAASLWEFVSDIPRIGRAGLELGASACGVVRRRLPRALQIPALWLSTSGIPSTAPGSAAALMFLAVMHRLGVQRPIGGCGQLAAALVSCIRAHGGVVEFGCPVESLWPGKTWAIRAGGNEYTARRVVAAFHAQHLLERIEGQPLGRLDPPAPGNGIAVRLLGTRLPAWSNGPRAGAMQSLVRSIECIMGADRPTAGQTISTYPIAVGTPSAVDSTLCPPDQHLISVWAQGFREPVDENRALLQVQRQLEAEDPSLEGTWLNSQIITPARLASELGLVGGNLLHYEQRIGRMHRLRPRWDLSRIRLPLPGLYLGSASAHPGGGVTGLPGLLAAAAVQADHFGAESTSR